MKNLYLAVNVGSSSLKFTLCNDDEIIVDGNIEKIGLEGSSCKLKIDGKKIKSEIPINNLEEALKVMLTQISDIGIDIKDIMGIGHRVLHGGTYYDESVIIDDEVLENLESLKKYAPIHQGPEIEAIKQLRNLLPDTPNVAVFDTAFHQTMPKENKISTLAKEFNSENYGAHGTSVRYITDEVEKKLNKAPNIIVIHAGGGISVTLVINGKSYNTSMELTPNGGCLGGSRSGSCDPTSVLLPVINGEMTAEEANNLANHESGLKAIGGTSSVIDLRERAKTGDEKAILALTKMEKSIMSYTASYLCEASASNIKIDAIVFTAGIGENDPITRENVLKYLECLGIKINQNSNKNNNEIISSEDSNIPVCVIPTNEQKKIIDDTINKVEQYYKSKAPKRIK